MCGLFGTFSVSVPPDLDRRLDEAFATSRHRGPDDGGIEKQTVAGGILALGHVRLSIIDLSPGGHQPMHSDDGRYTVVYNGEIYNYRELRQTLHSFGYVFRTDSDTEVLLACWHRWGVRCLPRLRGMFAFVIFDRRHLTLTCVRDAFGIKPLFYSSDRSGFRFASELAPLLALTLGRPALNPQRAYEYLVWGSYDDGAATMYDGIFHLPPGHWMQFDLEGGQLGEPVRWWWPGIQEHRDLSFAQAVEQLRAMFLQNVRLHLRSDVPIGAALSGGIDSSAVVCVMRHLEPQMPIHTFSFVARGAPVDEEGWVDQVNRHVGAVAHKIVVAPHELAEDLDDMIRTQGEPFGSTSIYAQYRVFRLAKENGIIVTLDGQGADELLAGYIGFPGARIRSLLERRQLGALIAFARRWSCWPGRSWRQLLMSLCAMLIPRPLVPLALTLSNQAPVPPWLNDAPLRDAGVEIEMTLPERRREGYGRRLMESLRHALTGRGLSALLRHADRSAMRWSIESRVPFLTIDLAEFLLGLPEEYLISRHGETKHIFRAAMRGLVPQTILDRRDKIGFQTPEHTWLKRLGPEIQHWLDGIEEMPFLHAERCRGAIRAIIEGRKPFTSHAWRLINFCRWVQLANPRL